MRSDDGKEDSEQRPENERHQTIRPEVRRRFAEAVVLALYFLFEAHNVWPDSHGWALFSGALGTCAVLLIELPLKWWGAVSAVICVGAGIAYWFVGPATVPEIEVVGTLQPGNDPTPINGCDGMQPLGTYPIGNQYSDPNWVKILIGNNAIAASGMRKIIALQIGRCDVLSFERKPEGISVDADLYNASGRLVARIANNRIDVLTGNNVRLTRGDLSTLLLKDEGGDELLYVRFMNPATVKVRGMFGCPGHLPIRVKDNEPISGIFMQNSCLVDSSVGFAVR